MGKAWDCLPGASPMATELPYSSADGKAVYRGREERKKPNGEGKQVSHGQDVKVRERRRAETFLNIIEDPGKLYEAKVKETRKLESRMMRKYPVRFGGGLGEKAIKTDLARSLSCSDPGFHAAEGDPTNVKLCQRGEWEDRMLVETVLSMLTLVCHLKKVMHRGWGYFQARLHHGGLQCARSVAWLTAHHVGFRAALDR